MTRMRTGTIAELLASEGIRTTRDVGAFCKRNVVAGKSESNYMILVRKFGEANADRIMRLVEVAEWDFDKKARTKS